MLHALHQTRQGSWSDGASTSLDEVLLLQEVEFRCAAAVEVDAERERIAKLNPLNAPLALPVVREPSRKDLQPFLQGRSPWGGRLRPRRQSQSNFSRATPSATCRSCSRRDWRSASTRARWRCRCTTNASFNCRITSFRVLRW